MIASIEYVRRKFAEYNELCFGGKLNPLPFRLSRARTFLGQLRFRRRPCGKGTWQYSDFVFVISTKYDYPEAEIEDTILHEMIHYYILSNQIQDTAPHGKVFRHIMNDINRRFHRNISVTHRRTKEEQDKDTEVRQHLVCVIRLKSGKTGITIAARTRLFQLWDQLPSIPEIAECKWYVSTDPYFNRFPRAISLKVYPIPSDEINAHLSGAQPLERHGNTIRVKKTDC